MSAPHLQRLAGPRFSVQEAVHPVAKGPDLGLGGIASGHRHTLPCSQIVIEPNQILS